MTPRTNEIWLNELLLQLTLIPELYPKLIKGSRFSTGLAVRRYEIISSLPDYFTHVMFIDPDDLIDIDGLRHAIYMLPTSTRSSLLLLEQQFREDLLIGKPRICCRVITELGLAKEIAGLTYAKGLPDKAYAVYLHNERRVQVSSKVAYYWRRHDKQISWKGER